MYVDCTQPARFASTDSSRSFASASSTNVFATAAVRHAEKATEENEPGVPLSDAGRARAARLAGLLKNAGVTAVYATGTDRARQTAEPLARALKLDVRIYPPRDAAGKLAPQLLLD